MARSDEQTKPRDRRSSRRPRPDGQREFTISSIYARARTDDGRVPYLRLSGQWLEQLGFARGSRVLVAPEDGKLVITIAPVEAPIAAPRPVRRIRPLPRRPYLSFANVMQRRHGVQKKAALLSVADDGRGCDRRD